MFSDSLHPFQYFAYRGLLKANHNTGKKMIDSQRCNAARFILRVAENVAAQKVAAEKNASTFSASWRLTSSRVVA